MKRHGWLGWARSSALAIGMWLALGACGDGGDSNPGDDDDDDDLVADPDAGDAPDFGIDAPDLTWTWIPVDGTKCMDGSATGMAVNVNPNSRKLMIYLEGGGACFNAFTCSGVAHQNGFGQAEFEQLIRDSASDGVFNRDDDDNPFAEWSYVFVPYCTGDIFAGSNPNGFGGRTQVGYDNVGAYTQRLVEGFTGVDHVVLTGSSAGGFGAAYNFDRVQQAFGATRVTLLDDSGPPLGVDYMTPCFQERIREVWNLDATLPQGCAECLEPGGLSKISDYLATKYPDRRFGLVTSTRDGVIRLFLGWGYPSCDAPDPPMSEEVFAAGVAELRDVLLEPYDNFAVYTIESGLHVWLLENPVGGTRVGDVGLTDWIRDLLADASGWDDVIP